MMDFDFVIVGAGSAGCVLAERLSAGGRHQVLLLEAGGSDRRFWIRVPVGYGRTFYDPRVNWMYHTEAVPGADHRISYWPRGKVLGGSSAINAMVYIRGQAEDYDAWAAAGNPGWGWDDVLPLFRRMESHPLGEGPYHGGSGPLHVSDPQSDLHPLCESFLAAAGELGLEPNPDFNGARQEGVGRYHITTRGGTRMSAARAYLHRARGRENLTVVTGAHAARILFDGARASGVEYLADGERLCCRASREVIVSAGAINSPQLLMLSGIGPAETLREYGIDIVSANPAVGGNLQDHYGIDHFYESTVPTLNNRLRPWWGKLLAGLEYLALRRGPLAISLNQAGGFFRTRPDLPRPNMQLYFSPLSYLKAPPGTRPLMNPDPYPGFMLGICQCRPTSRGYLTLAGADPRIPPRIQPNYLATEHDIAENLEGVRFLRRLSRTRALGDLIRREIEPGIEVDDDAGLAQHIRARGSSVFHPVSTCRMGPDDGHNVVDHRLRVYGVDGLRVADASIFPTMPSGNTNAAAIMVGEKASDLIRADHGD